MDIKILASGSKGNAYTVSDGETTLLLDAGISLQRIREGMGFRLREVTAALITHEHQDHIFAAQKLAAYGVDVYASAGTIAAGGLSGHRIHMVTARQPFDVGTFRILPFEVEHDAAEPLGYLCASKTGEKLLYVTDTYFVRYRFKGLTHIMVECNYSEESLRRAVEGRYTPIERVPRLMHSHMSLETLKGMLEVTDLSRVQQIYLLHMSDDNGDSGQCRDEIARLTGAEVYVC